ncbi:hypothetical protein ACLB2K_013594 [Fragaria x ananassa]
MTALFLGWKGILDFRDLLTQGLRWTVGNGRSINFWTFNWVFPFPLSNLLNDSQKASINWNDSVADFMTNKCWNKQKLLQVLDHSIVNQILGIPIPVCDQEDELIWGPSCNGNFSIKTATWLQVQVALHYLQSYKNHNSGLGGVSTQNPLAIIKWHPPPPNFCKLNFDGSVNHMNSAATGFIIRDDNGQFVVDSAKRVGSSSVPTA